MKERPALSRFECFTMAHWSNHHRVDNNQCFVSVRKFNDPSE